ncbi:MAG: AMP-binding protein [Alphaproteobacteria bacterium]
MRNNIGLYLGKRAHLNPDLEAAVDTATGRRLSYREIDAGANRVANGMRGLGIKKGDRVAILMMNSVEYVERFMGLAKIGAVAMIYGSNFAAVADTLQGRVAADTDIVHWIEFCEAGHVRDVFAMDYGDVVGHTSTEAPEIDSGDDDDLFIMYTSGTTGLPKGALHTHNTMTWAIITFTTTTDIRYKDRYSIALPLFHVGGLLPVMFTNYTAGTVVLLRQFDPKLMWEITEAEKITTSLAVPAMLNAMLMVPEFARYDVSNLGPILPGASPVPVSLIEKYQDIGIEIHQAYSLTEVGGPGTVLSPDEAMVRIGWAGKGFFHTSVRVVDGDGNVSH